MKIVAGHTVAVYPNPVDSEINIALVEENVDSNSSALIGEPIQQEQDLVLTLSDFSGFPVKGVKSGQVEPLETQAQLQWPKIVLFLGRLKTWKRVLLGKKNVFEHLTHLVLAPLFNKIFF